MPGMCLAAVAVACSDRFPFVVASNRDEFHARAAAPLAWWVPAAGAAPVLGGRDLEGGGTWLGLNAAGRLALVTNVREPGRFDPAAPTRGTLVTQALAAPRADERWLDGVLQVPRNGYNLLLAEIGAPQLLWAGNRAGPARRLGPGLYGLSNAALDTPWPKVVQLEARLADALALSRDAADLALALFAALADRRPAPDAALPATGVPLARERQLSPAFIHVGGDGGAGAYGTRCSTLVIAERRGRGLHTRVIERRFDAAGAVEGETTVELP